MRKTPKIIIILSGGLDSTVLLFQILSEGATVKALSVDYTQRHVREIRAAETICKERGVYHEIANFHGISHLLTGSSLTSRSIAVPEGHYADNNMKATVVPNRNMLFIATAAAWAISSKYDAVAYAAHAGDHMIYPDCREEFVQALDKAVQLADWHSVRVLRPFISMTKAAIVKRGSELGVPFAKTWSCYKGGATHCGKCGTCIERREAFILAGIKDPTEYESIAVLPTRYYPKSKARTRASR